MVRTLTLIAPLSAGKRLLTTFPFPHAPHISIPTPSNLLSKPHSPLIQPIAPAQSQCLYKPYISFVLMAGIVPSLNFGLSKSLSRKLDLS
jgi:hypothetical protein